MIPPKEWEPFVSEKDALTRLKAMGLVSATKKQCVDETENHKLDTLVEELGLTGGETHRALNDAGYTLQILDICRERMLGEDFRPFGRRKQ